MSAPLNNGGPAFPLPGERWDEGEKVARSWDAPGMSLRDYFAAKALQGLLANPNVVVADSNCGWSLCNTDHSGLAKEALAQADAMLAAREAK